jgi:hypothetical protein
VEEAEKNLRGVRAELVNLKGALHSLTAQVWMAGKLDHSAATPVVMVIARDAGAGATPRFNIPQCLL